MGCGASNSAQIVNADPEFFDINSVWDKAWQTVEVKKRKGTDLVVKRRGWKTIRVFVSSTFKDFHAEREVLVKKVFPDLRVWCEARRLYLVECDLRWGVPKDFTTEGTLRACLGEIDRCYQDNIMPFFINMTSERIGWVPNKEEVPESVQSEYKWVDGMSVTEMEIMHGAYRIDNPNEVALYEIAFRHDNPNAMFLIRDSNFLKTVPEERKGIFVDGQEIAPAKLAVLKKKIQERFPKDRVLFYNCEWLGYNETTKMPELGGLDTAFSDKVFEFFKKRIEKQYPLAEGKLDTYQLVKDQHEGFMRSRADRLIGREEVTKEIDGYLCGAGNDVPYILLGGPGSGKSSLVAKMTDVAVTKAAVGRIPGAGRGDRWKVFYHFVGAVPGSTELLPMLRRLLKEMEVHKDEASLPSDLDTAAQQTSGALANPKTKPTIIIVDALNQFDEDDAAVRVSWVPRKLAPQVRIVFSMIGDTPQHKNLINREPSPTALQLTPLTKQDRQAIVDELLGVYNKRLDDDQMESLLSKSSSENPLWLSIACEELRVFGQFRQLSDKINQLSDGLLELEIQVIERFEKENGGTLLVGTLCLLEVSARGLLESELLTILGDEDGLMPGDKHDDSEKKDRGTEKAGKSAGQLPAYKWSEVYRALRPFLRPFGDSGEGRLDFYHRSLSKAVRRKYFLTSDGKPKTEFYNHWHKKLADYFEKHCANLSRQIEELPFHLTAIQDSARLEKFLTRWDVFDELYDFNYSMKLLAFWRKGSSYDNMGAAYTTAVNNFANSPGVTADQKCRRFEQIGQLCAQSGQWVPAEEFSKKAQEIEKDQLGARPERMADLFYLQAKVQDEIMKLEEYMYRSQLPRIRTVIACYESSAEVRKTLIGEEHQDKLGRTYNRLAFYYSSVTLRGGDEHISREQSEIKAMESVENGIKIFTELKDDANLADCYTTKGVVYGRACPEQIKAYNEAMELGLKTVGPIHPMMDRLLLNMAIYYEETGDYNKAYDLFYQWYETAIDIYGAEHPKSARPVNTLREPMYKRIAQERGKAVPEVYVPGQPAPAPPADPAPAENANNSNNHQDSVYTTDNVPPGDNLHDDVTAEMADVQEDTQAMVEDIAEGLLQSVASLVLNGNNNNSSENSNNDNLEQ